ADRNVRPPDPSPQPSNLLWREPAFRLGYGKTIPALGACPWPQPIHGRLSEPSSTCGILSASLLASSLAPAFMKQRPAYSISHTDPWRLWAFGFWGVPSVSW